ncbi:MAG: glycosyltransferase family 2 protein [Patulibacter minatonensis]
MARVIAITRSFNEVDIVEHSIRWMLTQVDHIIVGDNSSDGSRELLRDLEQTGRVTVVHDTAPNFAQAEILTAFAKSAREDRGAEWIVPFDLDERFFAAEGTIAEQLAALPAEILKVQVPNLTHCVTTEDDSGQRDPFRAMQWRSVEQLPLRKVVVRAHPGLRLAHGNHDASFDGVTFAPELSGVLEARHFPYRSPEQFAKRVIGAYGQLKASGLPRTHGQHMHEYGELYEAHGLEGLHEWFRNGMLFDRPGENPELVYDPAPW